MKVNNKVKINELVSVVISSYNYGRFIGKAIESVLTQDYPNIELIVSDNCSSDETLEVVSKYCHDRRLKLLVNESNLGALENFRLLIERAKGKYIVHISADDYLVDSRFVSNAVDKFVMYPKVRIVRGRNGFEFNESKNITEDVTYLRWRDRYYHGSPIDGKQLFLEYPEFPSVGIGGSMYRREDICGFAFDENGKILHQGNCFYYDALFTLKIILNGDVCFLPSLVYVNRLHGSNHTGRVRAKVVIDNFLHIADPYSYAHSLSIFSQSTLKTWLHKMIINYYRQVQLYFFRTDKESYTIVRKWLMTNHYEACRAIELEPRFILYKFFCKFPLLLRFWPILGRLRARLIALVNLSASR